M
ncbi:Late transcription factor VLTF-4 (1), partial [Monkeypox virus]|jgi:hypothetical protein|eukprot:jgi/Mesen1/7077/ME000369S06395